MDNIKKGDNRKSTTDIIQGSDNVVNGLVQLMEKAHRINVCVDNTRPLLAIEFKQIKDAFIDAKKRGVTVRYITEITKKQSFNIFKLSTGSLRKLWIRFG
jgi:sugar-specific transcriptional regulator TrmB